MRSGGPVGFVLLRERVRGFERDLDHRACLVTVSGARMQAVGELMRELPTQLGFPDAEQRDYSDYYGSNWRALGGILVEFTSSPDLRPTLLLIERPAFVLRNSGGVQHYMEFLDVLGSAQTSPEETADMDTPQTSLYPILVIGGGREEGPDVETVQFWRSAGWDLVWLESDGRSVDCSGAIIDMRSVW